MWFVRLFIFVIGIELVYMLVFQETTAFFRRGESYTLTLKFHPLRFILLFIGLVAFEVMLVRVHAAMGREMEDNNTGRKSRGKRR